MGRGSSSKEINVIKNPGDLKITTETNSTNVKEIPFTDCLFRLELKVQIDNSTIAKEIKVGQFAALVPEKGTLQIYIHTFNVGIYSGEYVQKILTCIKSGFVYEGKVSKLEINENVTTAILDISGGKR